MHSVAPECFWKVPGRHGSHAWLRSLSEKWPFAHGVAFTLPMLQKWPALHCEHCDALTMSVASEYVPRSHGSGELAPAGQYEPAMQLRQLVAPMAS
jgi:hypothetical protein